MKKLFWCLVLLVALGAAYLLGTFKAGKTIELPPAEWATGCDAAMAWRELVTSLEAAGAKVYDNPKFTEQDRAEGLRYVTELLAEAVEMHFWKGEVRHPHFTDWNNPFRKILGDSPDAVYHTAPLSADYRYRITGKRGSVGYLGFMLYGKRINGWNRPAANLSVGDLILDKAGNFNIVLSKEHPSESNVNWLPLEEDIHMVMVRQYFHDRSKEKLARFSIENLSISEKPGPLTEARVARGLRAATTFFNNTLDGAIALTSMLAKSPNDPNPPKSFNADLGGVYYPTSDNIYLGGWYKLAEDEALVIEGDVPDAPYWSVSLQNRWMQSFDYLTHTVSLHNRQLQLDGNGRYCVVIAHSDPLVPNWLETTGHPEGMVAIRYQRSKNKPRPTMRVVKVAELH